MKALMFAAVVLSWDAPGDWYIATGVTSSQCQAQEKEIRRQINSKPEDCIVVKGTTLERMKKMHVKWGR